MAKYRTVRLLLHLGKKRADYALILRTVGGQDTTDRRLSWGSLPLPQDHEGPDDLLPLLQRVVWDLHRRHGLTAPAQRPEAPGGGGGRPDAEQVETLPLFLISERGQTIDFDGQPI
jgi:hypothetical protein